MDWNAFPALARAASGKEPCQLVLKNSTMLNVFTKEWYTADIAVQEGMIVGIGSYQGKTEQDMTGKYIVPGYIDAHLHLESTLVTPPHLLENTLPHGTTTYIADPHEAANVLGFTGISFLLQQTEHVPANFYMMLPSCVPSTDFEMSGCICDAAEMAQHCHAPRVLGLGEVMDYVSVVNGAPEMLRKLQLFDNRPRDGHAPGLSDGDLNAYALAGIHTEHECMTFADALRKRRLGMHIHVREGSAARNLEAIITGLVESKLPTDGFSFCTDDLHIDDIRTHGHLDHCIRKAIALGLPPEQAYCMASINTAKCYGLTHLGAIAPGYQADFVVLSDIMQAEAVQVYHRGQEVTDWRAPACTIAKDSPLYGTVHIAPLTADDLAVPVNGQEQPVISLLEGQIATERQMMKLPAQNGVFVPSDGLNKLAVIERHHATGAVKAAALAGFGVKNGAIASTVSHDSHNILVAGDHDTDMLCAVEALAQSGGGYAIAQHGRLRAILPLPLLGLISDEPYDTVGQKLHDMLALAHEMGVPQGIDPFITLSFLALPVIPSLRLTPRGLFDVDTFTFLA